MLKRTILLKTKYETLYRALKCTIDIVATIRVDRICNQNRSPKFKNCISKVNILLLLARCIQLRIAFFGAYEVILNPIVIFL